jgi:hypothetical protein
MDGARFDLVPEDEEAEEGRVSDQVDELYARTKELEEEARQLWAELVSEKVDVPVSWGLEPMEETAYRLLVSRGLVTRDLFEFVLCHSKEGADAYRTVINTAARLRRKLRPRGIDVVSSYYAGWFLRKVSGA